MLQSLASDGCYSFEKRFPTGDVELKRVVSPPVQTTNHFSRAAYIMLGQELFRCDLKIEKIFGGSSINCSLGTLEVCCCALLCSS